jgi:hypothetical protein
VVASSPGAFAAAVREYRFAEYAFDRESVVLARRSVAEAGLLVVGEPHGVRETPSVLYALASALETRSVAFEWSHEEMDEPVQEFVRRGSFDFERLWSLPAPAEFFCGDGRITAGHFALLQRLRAERRLDQVIVFDRLDPVPPLDDTLARERELARRLLAEWDDRFPLLALAGAFHAQLGAAEGETMAACVARERPRLQPAMIEYAQGECWWRGGAHDVSGPMPEAPIRLRVPQATPAVVPGRAGA